MAPRGLKALLRKSSPAKLAGSGSWKGFQSLKTKRKLKGLTKRLKDRVWSDGILPLIARNADPSIRDKGCWKGKMGGQRRGTKVDQQLSKLINGGKMAIMRQKSMFKLTRLALSAMAKRGLDPVMAQRAVISEEKGLGTAADVIAFDKATNRLVVVELKCGYDHGRQAAAEKGGRPCKMRGPCGKALDSNVHRHLAQLSVTRELMAREKDTLKKVGDLGVDQNVEGVLMYVNDAGVEFYPLDTWWQGRGSKLIQAIAA
tara:strand:- start:12316 stop:13089 length:774 start_codon:yes stop_codon:yes gene_type:complete